MTLTVGMNSKHLPIVVFLNRHYKQYVVLRRDMVYVRSGVFVLLHDDSLGYFNSSLHVIQSVMWFRSRNAEQLAHGI